MNVFNFDEWSLSEALDDNKYYAYMIYKTSENKPLYIGHGTAGRTHVSLSDFKKKHGDAKLKIVGTHGTKEAAEKKEIELTKKFKLKEDGGTLIQKKTGTEPSKELRKSYSDGSKGVKKSSSHKENISKSLKKTVKSTEHRANIAKAMKGNNNAS